MVNQGSTHWPFSDERSNIYYFAATTPNHTRLQQQQHVYLSLRVERLSVKSVANQNTNREYAHAFSKDRRIKKKSFSFECRMHGKVAQLK